MTCSQYNQKTLRVDHSIDLEKGKYKKIHVVTIPIPLSILIITNIVGLSGFQLWYHYKIIRVRLDSIYLETDMYPGDSASLLKNY